MFLIRIIVDILYIPIKNWFVYFLTGLTGLTG